MGGTEVKKIIHRNSHLYYYEGRYATRAAAKKSAKSWQDYGSLTLITSTKAHYLYPKMTRTEYLLYKTRKNVR